MIELTKCKNNVEINIHIWFVVEETKKGIAVKNCWLDTEDIPQQLLATMVNRAASQLKSKEINLSTPNHKEVDLTFSESFEVPFTENKKNNEKAALKELCDKYKNDPSNIRNDEKVRHVCLNCGSDSSEYKRVKKDPYKPVSEFVPQGYIKSPEGYHRCSNCQNKWYVNYCWSCRNGRVDDRDPATPHCKECNWCKCDNCTSCSYYGCETTPYSHEYKYVDRIPDDLLQNLERI